jgi:membrane fusion protein (multidrug efflux system)
MIVSIIFGSIAAILAVFAFHFLWSRRLVLGAVFAMLSLLSALGAVKAPMIVLVIIFVSAATILFAFLAILFFRSSRTVSGAVFAVLALFSLLVDIKALQFNAMISAGKKMVLPPETVTSAVVKEEDWAPTLRAVGSISAVQGAVISAELAGVVSEVAFENGGTAKKGDLLVQLDASAEEAQLHSAEADLELARADLERSRDLVARKVISKAEIDAAESKFKQKSGAVDQMRSMITKKTVRAPFDGQLGIRQVNVGQSLIAGQEVVPLTALDSLFADFALPQQDLGKLSSGLEVHVTTDALPGRVFTGKLTAVNSMVNVTTRNVMLQATLENPEHLLRPGMFAKVEVILPEKHKSLVIPGSAISYAPFGDSVFVIEKKKDEKTGKESQTIRQQFVRVGEARGDFVSISKGLKAGETVVGTGVFKLRNGLAVTINNDLAPKPQIDPTPVDS